MLPPFAAIFSVQRALSTPFPTAVTAFRVVVAPDIRRLLIIDFISVSTASDTRGGLPTYFKEKKSTFCFFSGTNFTSFLARNLTSF